MALKDISFVSLLTVRGVTLLYMLRLVSAWNCQEIRITFIIIIKVLSLFDQFRNLHVENWLYFRGDIGNFCGHGKAVKDHLYGATHKVKNRSNSCPF